MSGNPLLLPARYTTQSKPSTDNRLASSVVWASQDDISSEFDVPYSPIITQSDTPQPPYPGGLRRRLGRALLPTVLVLSANHRKPRPRSLWDRVVFVWFCACLFLLSYTLAGFGYSGHDYATCTLSTSYALSSAQSGAEASSVLLKGIVRENQEGEGMDWVEDGGLIKDHRAVPESYHLADVTAELLNPAPATAPPDRIHEGPQNKHKYHACMANLPAPRKLADNNPFDLEPFLEGGGYGNDGQPFALKIHVPQDGPSSRAGYHGENSKRCRGSGRC
jgi:hypothetical protein